MAQEISIESLRAAIRRKDTGREAAGAAAFEAMARRFERAVEHLISQIAAVVGEIPELDVALEDEREVFTSPAFPDRSVEISSRRARITRGEDMLLFDPTAKALLSALGQVEIEATRPIPFLVEKVLYLIPDRSGGPARWGFRSVRDLGGPLAPFTRSALLEMLAAVFAAE